jgi:hypothetical protein
MGTKLVELFANRVVERRNMINVYLRGRACIEIRELIQGEHIFWAFLALFFVLPLFVSFIGLAASSSSRWHS